MVYDYRSLGDEEIKRVLGKCPVEGSDVNNSILRYETRKKEEYEDRANVLSFLADRLSTIVFKNFPEEKREKIIQSVYSKLISDTDVLKIARRFLNLESYGNSDEAQGEAEESLRLAIITEIDKTVRRDKTK